MPTLPPPIVFDDRIAQHYDTYLGPFLFEPFALDLAHRVLDWPVTNALELACGTGRLTRHLRAGLPHAAHLLATDLNPGMLAVARQAIPASNIAWSVVDMVAIPYGDDQFDLIICQFGVMFSPDKPRTFRELYRVLKPGGRLLFNTWAPVAGNDCWRIAATVVAAVLGSNPFASGQGPFAMQDEQATLRELHQAGFREPTVVPVQKTGHAPTAAQAAHGFLHGLPLAQTLQAKDPASLPQMQAALEQEFRQQLGDHPLQSSLRAWVFEAGK